METRTNFSGIHPLAWIDQWHTFESIQQRAAMTYGGPVDVSQYRISGGRYQDWLNVNGHSFLLDVRHPAAQPTVYRVCDAGRRQMRDEWESWEAEAMADWADYEDEMDTRRSVQP